MTRYRLFLVALGLIAGMTQLAHAGPVADFETEMRQAYGDYRTALFTTNMGDAQKAAGAIDGFLTGWKALMDANMTPPPQYADDGQYAETMKRVETIADDAGQQVEEGNLSEAHETLEAIRDEIGALHDRNGIIGFSDRMNAYHAKMEDVLMRDYAGFAEEGLGMLREDAAVLDYLASQIAAHPPAEASDPAYSQSLSAMKVSVAALIEAARGDDADVAAKAVSGLKAPYSKLFLKFG